MDKSFLDYYKYVLEKVSFDENLFNKEFRKALNMLEKHDEKRLLQWIKDKGLNSNLVSVKTRERKIM